MYVSKQIKSEHLLILI